MKPGPLLARQSFLPTATTAPSLAFWAAYIDDKLPTQGPLLLESTNEEIKANAKETVFAALQQLELALVDCSKGKSFFGGHSIGYIDIVLGSLISSLKVPKIMIGINFLDETKTPRLVEWVERFSAVEAAKEVLPEAEKLVEFRKFKGAKSNID